MKIAILLVCCTLCSCATLLNKEHIQIEVHTVPDSSFVCLDNDKCVRSPLILEVPRSYDDFELMVKNDSSEKTVRIPSRVAPEFVWGNLFWIYGIPAGYVIDATSGRKIYSYDNSILVNLNTTSKGYLKYHPSRQGQIYLRTALPWFDFVRFDNGRGADYYETYMGFTAGIDYYHSGRSYVSFEGGLAGVSEIGIPVMDRWYDTARFIVSSCVKLTNNHDFRIFTSEKVAFTVGYGLQVTNFNYRQVLNDTLNNRDIELYKNSKTALGLCFQANVILFKHGFIGINVLPSFYTLNTNEWNYSYLGYIDFGLRIPLGNYKKNKLQIIKYKPLAVD